MRQIGLIPQESRQIGEYGTDRSHPAIVEPMERIDSPRDLGAAIRARRNALEITQDDLALAIGVNRKVIGQLERGKQTVRLEIALSAARALGLNIGVEARGEAGS
jgi:HTH-type transcriptional regulator / antitoxin HipB